MPTKRHATTAAIRGRPRVRTTPPRTAAGARSALTPVQRHELERELRRERARLERALEAARARRGAAAPLSDDAPASARADEGMARTLESRMLAHLDALVDALRRIDDGTYGTCARCERPIPYGRLLTVPETTRCIAC